MSLVSRLLQAHPHLLELPVREVLPQLSQQLRESSDLCVLEAPPGSGKTLLAPLWLAENAAYRRVFVLVPRRVNARLPVLFLEPSCGPAVGYRIRLESRWNEQQLRVGYLTYGTALRSFATQPPGADDLVIFDEFHERPWEADLLLAHLRAARKVDRGPHLLLMSATMDQAILPAHTPLVKSDGRLHPVEIARETVEPSLLVRPERLAELVGRRSAELASRGGEQLIFLPGLAAIRAVESALRVDAIGQEVDILHSSLPETEIRRVVERPMGRGFRRILSTDLAESSVTLPGVTTVIDAGLQRRPRRDDFGLGITLETVRAPLSSLIQRAGRAGRTQPGYCHRLLTYDDELRRDGFAKPQLLEVDGKLLALHLAALGRLEEWMTLDWLAPPKTDMIEAGRGWLEHHKLSRAGSLTRSGQTLLSSTCSPRVGLFALLARQAGWPLTQVVDWSYALEHGPPATRSSSCSLSELLLDKTWTRQRDPRLLKRLHDTFSEPMASESSGDPLLTAFADTLVELRADRALPYDPKVEALLYRTAHPPDSRYAVVLGTAPSGRDGPVSSVTLLHNVTDDAVWENFLEEISESSELLWDEKARAVKELRKTKLGSLTLEEEKVTPLPGPRVAEFLRQRLRPEDFGADFTLLSRRLQLFWEGQPAALETMPELGSHKGEDPLESLLRGYLETVTSWDKSASEGLLQHLQQLLGYRFLQTLETALPTTVKLPGRQRPVPVIYPEQGAPYVASKLQDFFGWSPPRLLGGRLPLACHLLAPSGRPVQITEDLDRFWEGSYQQVRKDLRGRYPKHAWPEKP